jgi:hypothetical protein
VLFPKTTTAPFTADRNTKEDSGLWLNLEFATDRGENNVGIEIEAASTNPSCLPPRSYCDSAARTRQLLQK